MRKRVRFLYVVFLVSGLLMSLMFVIERFGPTLVSVAERSTETFSTEIAAFKARDARSGFRADAILFVGSADFKLWRDMEARFAPRPIINRGFGGAHLRHVLRYYDDVVKVYKPRALVIYAGENDIAASVKPGVVLGDFDKLMNKVRADFPAMPVLVVSLKPSPLRFDDLAVQLEVNEGIKQRTSHDDNLYYVDVVTPMLQAGDQGISDSLFVADQLHLTKEGYDIWAREIGWHFDRLFGRIELGPVDRG
ncbi:MAG: GDSL-type esterase/lipase family protein [Alphaproteobacteria bacterium]